MKLKFVKTCSQLTMLLAVIVLATGTTVAETKTYFL